MLTHSKPNPNSLPGFGEISETPNLTKGSANIVYSSDEILMIDNLLSDQSCDDLIKIFEDSGTIAPVSVNGLKDEMSGKGSMRFSGWSEHIANELTSLVIPHLSFLCCDEFTATDWYHPVIYPDYRLPTLSTIWKPIQVSPLLRFMRYENESEHYAHYDAGFLYPDNFHRTLKSLVIYLTDNEIGATRFIKDGQEDVPVWRRNHCDWSRRVLQEEVLLESLPKKGKVLIFDHRLCHDVQQYFPKGNEKNRMIIRCDIIYQPVV